MQMITMQQRLAWLTQVVAITAWSFLANLPTLTYLWGQHGHKHYHLLYIIFTFPWRNSTQSANLRLLPNLSLRQCPSSIICTTFIGPNQDGDRSPKVVDVVPTEVGIVRLAVTLAKSIKSWIYFASWQFFWRSILSLNNWTGKLATYKIVKYINKYAI